MLNRLYYRGILTGLETGDVIREVSDKVFEFYRNGELMQIGSTDSEHREDSLVVTKIPRHDFLCCITLGSGHIPTDTTDGDDLITKQWTLHD